MPLVSQPSALPTNKLMVAALIGPAATEAWGAVMITIYPPLSGEAMSAMVGGIAALVVGYFVKDFSNAQA